MTIMYEVYESSMNYLKIKRLCLYVYLRVYERIVGQCNANAGA